MKKPLLLCVKIILYTFITSVYSQMNKIEVHPEFDIPGQEILKSLVASGEYGACVVLKKKLSGYDRQTVLRKFNNDLELNPKAIPLIRKLKGFKEESLGFLERQDTLIHLSKVSNKTSSKLSIKRISLSEFDLIDTKIIKEFVDKDHNQKKSEMFFFESDDASFVGLLYLNFWNEKEPINYKLIIFDKNFNTGEEVSFDFVPNDPQRIIDQMVLGNDGEIYLLTHEYNRQRDSFDSLEDSNEQIDYKYKIFGISRGKLSELTSFSNQNKWLDRIVMSYDNDVLKIRGLYSNVSKYHLAGYFFFDYNVSLRQNNSSIFFPVEDEIIDQFAQYEFLKEKKILLQEARELPNMVLKDIFSTEDGSSFIITEHKLVSTEIGLNFIHGNILISKLNDKGELVWSKAILKNDSNSRRAMFSSFSHKKQADRIIFFYNGNVKNFHSNLPKETIHWTYGLSKKNRCVVKAELSYDGLLNQEIVADVSQLDGFAIMPKFDFFKENDELVFLACKPSSNLKKNLKFISVK